MRKAVTLPELMLVLAVLGILLSIAVPTLGKTLDRLELEAATHRLVSAHQRARIMAITHSQVMTLTVDSAQLVIHRRGMGGALWSEAGPAVSGVTLSGPSHQFIFSPEGFTLGLSNATLRLARGSASRSIIISRLGRIRVTR
jgi:prepilin-type N-terminal cleavage/methylation domain-containing protein